MRDFLAAERAPEKQGPDSTRGRRPSDTELVRATCRAELETLVRARLVLDVVTLQAVRTELFERAGRLDPSVSRSLDALHIAAALDCGDDLEGMLTYDDRLAVAATANGVPVVTPT